MQVSLRMQKQKRESLGVRISLNLISLFFRQIPTTAKLQNQQKGIYERDIRVAVNDDVQARRFCDSKSQNHRPRKIKERENNNNNKKKRKRNLLNSDAKESDVVGEIVSLVIGNG